ncbi:hypothetical protein ACFOPQ_03180 [Deinococcus antarcticus]|uniref:Uncharacterized protein n=1 Tax=Deinococcus antarcticus TaxID=1298767 RepID=A0ABV8A5J9_9DEIO
MNAEVLTNEGLKLALQTVGDKWKKQGAKFLKDVQYGQADITGLFVFDGVVYELTIKSDKTLHVFEMDGDERRAVPVPVGLPFPKGFVRNAGRGN